jgi:hypothetical protein
VVKVPGAVAGAADFAFGADFAAAGGALVAAAGVGDFAGGVCAISIAGTRNRRALIFPG